MSQLLKLPLLFLLLSRIAANEEVKQFPPLIMAQEGDTINITCISSGPSLGVYLKRTAIMFMNILHFSERRELILNKEYMNRTFLSGSLKNLVITIINIQLNDTDVYTCENTALNNLLGSGTMVVVTEKKWEKESEDRNPENPQLWMILSVIFFFAGVALWPLLMIMKKWVYKFRKTQNVPCNVYEDMSYSNQRNTTCQNNQYS
ncbi:T-cell antigen CD7 [Macrotis lagotis]|uniref:T-cell antigen CD7 n=1 Tax=Macrotis lagotis TaxID=92651 RepID=UPI003D698CF5